MTRTTRPCASLLDPTGSSERRHAARALVDHLGGPGVDDRLLAVLADPDPYVFQLALDGLLARADPPAARVLAIAAAAADAAGRIWHDNPALEATICQLDADNLDALFASLLDDRDDAVRAGARLIIEAVA
jgi:hypothetical protein